MPKFKYEVGDRVEYISKCYDHSSNEFLKLNETYTIKRLHIETNGYVYLEEVRWWVFEKHLKLSEENATLPKDPKIRAVCKKIKQMEKRFEQRKLTKSKYEVKADESIILAEYF